MKPARADLALIGATLIWGCTFLLVKNALASVSPILFLALRFAVAAAALGLVYRKRLNRPGIRAGLVTGLFLFGGYAFQTAGLQFTSAAKSAFLTSLSIPMVPLAGWFVYRNGPKPLEMAGLVLSSAGMVLLTAPDRFVKVSRGDVLSFFCAICFSGQIVAVGYFSRRVDFEALAFMQMLTACVLSLASFWWIEKPMLSWNRPVFFAVLLTGLLASAMAFSVQAWAQQYTSVTRAAIIFALEPVFAWLTSWMLAGENLTRTATFGAVLIFFGILIVEVKRSAVAEHP